MIFKWSGRQDLNLAPYDIFQCFLVGFIEKVLLKLICYYFLIELNQESRTTIERQNKSKSNLTSCTQNHVDS